MSASVAAVAGAGLVLVLGRRAPVGAVVGGRAGGASGARGVRRMAVPAPVLAAISLAWVGVVLGPPAAALAAAGAVAARSVRHRRARAQAARAVEQALPELVDLLRLAASAGLPVRLALEAVAPRVPEVLHPALVAALRADARGLPLAVGLERMADRLGPAGHGVVAALDRSAATGAALGPLLAEVAAEARDIRRRSAQEAARRLSVTLLFPLVCCTLPAAVLIAVVPVVVVAVDSLRA